MQTPTQESYSELQIAFDHFNEQLFENALPHCLITLQRERRTYGYFASKRFIKLDGERTDEIAMNPTYFAVCPIEEILQTLVHEMTHLWQYHHGNPGRRSYHNREWADKMESIGLMPSSTGEPGGRRTGDSVADYIIEGGEFESACKMLLTKNFRITWMDRYPDKKKLQETQNNPEIIGTELMSLGELAVEEAPANKSNRQKYTCPDCSINAWGKPGLNLQCGDCGVQLQPSA